MSRFDAEQRQEIQRLAGQTTTGPGAVSLDSNADSLLSLATQQLGLDPQQSNRVFAGPASGSAAIPTFRALTAADLPSDISGASHTRLHDILGALDHSVTGATNQIVGLSGTNTLGLLTPSVTAGDGLTGGGNPVAGITLNVGAGAGLVANADDVAVGAGDGIVVNANDVAVNVAYAFEWEAKHTFQAGLKLSNGQHLEVGDDVYLTRTASDVLGLGSGDAFQSNDFVSGISGWRIAEDGSAEFRNATIRGELHTSVFVANEMHASGGTLAILNASTVAKPINASDNILVGVGSTMNVVVQAAPATGLCPFAKGDVVRVKGFITR